MGYTEDALSTGEQITYRTRKHWMAPIQGTVLGTSLAAGGLAALIVDGLWVDGGALDTLLSWAGWAALVVGALILAASFARWYSEDYVVTNHKVMKVSGITRKTTSGASLEKINDVVMSQGMLGRMLGYGDLQVLTGSDAYNLNFRTMREPAEFRRAMLDAKAELGDRDAANIAEAVRQGMPAAASAAAAAAPAPDPQQIAERIAALTQLRDSGAINEAEFEAKKKELLDRL